MAAMRELHSGAVSVAAASFISGPVQSECPWGSPLRTLAYS